MSNKKLAEAFLKEAGTGNVSEAYEKYVADNFIHHNPYFPADKQSLMQGMVENTKQFPHKTLTVKHILEDGDLVMTHSHLQMQPDDVGMAVCHLFRFENDKIVELWDIGQQIPKNNPNTNGVF